MFRVVSHLQKVILKMLQNVCLRNILFLAREKVAQIKFTQPSRYMCARVNAEHAIGFHAIRGNQ